MKNNAPGKDIADRFQKVFGGDDLIILESQSENHPASTKTILAARPGSWIRATGTNIEWELDGERFQFNGNPWNALEEFREKCNNWMLGYLGYDLKNYTEQLISRNRAVIPVPDLWFMVPEQLVVLENGIVKTISGDPLFPETVKKESRYREAGFRFDISPAITRRRYIETVHHIQQKIRNGDFYELNFTYPMTGVCTLPAYELYKAMRLINPVPFGAYLKVRDTEICCSSPERFLKKTGQKIVSQPIKGTSGRSKNPDEDEIRKNELLNEKNRAENLMIVDLVRHDFSKVAETGTVTVSGLFEMQSFETVHQLLSTIEANVRGDVSVVDILKHCFPMGSMTGAPKIEVMKAIDELEQYKRGIYSGAIGYMTPEGDFDFNVVIRTAILQQKEIVYPVGGAITSDSDPISEWEETKIKARTLLNVFAKNGIVQK